MPALAQSSVAPRSEAAITAVKAPASAAKAPQTVAANARSAPLASTTTVTAAGSVIILSDGIVANATLAQIQPPAPDSCTNAEPGALFRA